MARKRTLLVEGPDDQHVLMHICGNRSIGELDSIKTHGGVDTLLESIPVYLKAAGDAEVVGIVIDADTDVAARWDSLRNHLSRVGYANVPIVPNANGTIIDPPIGKLLPRVGIWIMPDNQTEGILEDFLRFLVPPSSRLFDHVIKSVASIASEDRLFSQFAEPKVLIHTWLAWQEEPGKPLGTAITARYLDANVLEVDVLVDWLKRLYFP